MNTEKIDTQLKKNTQAISAKLSISQALICPKSCRNQPKWPKFFTIDHFRSQRKIYTIGHAIIKDNLIISLKSTINEAQT